MRIFEGRINAHGKKNFFNIPYLYSEILSKKKAKNRIKPVGLFETH